MYHVRLAALDLYGNGSYLFSRGEDQAMDERQIKDLKGWCERMAASSIQFDKTAGECGEMIHFKENKLFL